MVLATIRGNSWHSLSPFGATIKGYATFSSSQWRQRWSPVHGFWISPLNAYRAREKRFLTQWVPLHQGAGREGTLPLNSMQVGVHRESGRFLKVGASQKRNIDINPSHLLWIETPFGPAARPVRHLVFGFFGARVGFARSWRRAEGNDDGGPERAAREGERGI